MNDPRVSAADATDCRRQVLMSSFGSGIHFGIGSRATGLLLRVLREAIVPRFDRIEVQGELTRC